jgi:hydroxyethylthiazole kinase
MDAAIAALVLFAEAGERAEREAEGPGSFGWRFLDALAAVTPDDLTRTPRVTWS